MIVLALIVISALAMTGCGSEDAQGEGSQSQVTDVSLISKIDDSNRYATIVGTDDQGDVVWTIKTDEYPAAELDCFSDIGIYQDQYYYVENGNVVCLALDTGEKKWENPDFQGSPTQYCHYIDDDGSVYLSGYYGPDFYAVDKDGVTINRIKQVDGLYYWPSEMHVDGDKITIIMEGSADGNGGEIYIDLSQIERYGSSSDSSDTSTGDGYTNEELVEKAEAYYRSIHGDTPPIVEVDSENGDEVMIHLYEDMGDHTATYDWYTVDRNTLKGQDVLGNDIDLSTVN